MSVQVNVNGRVKQFDYLTYEASGRGDFNVHGWGTYDRNSVLAGQPKKQFIDTLDTIEEIEANYPDATGSNKFMQPQNSYNHLPDTQDGYDWDGI